MPLTGKKKSRSKDKEMSEMESLDRTPMTSIQRASSDVTEKVAQVEAATPVSRLPWRRASFDGDVLKILTPKSSFTSDIATDVSLDGNRHYYDERDYQLHRRASYHHHSAFGHHHHRSHSRPGSRTSSFAITPSRKSLLTPSSSKSLTRSVPEELKDEVDGATDSPVLIGGEKPKFQFFNVPEYCTHSDPSMFTLGGEPLDHDKILGIDQRGDSDSDVSEKVIIDVEPGIPHPDDVQPEITDDERSRDEDETSRKDEGEREEEKTKDGEDIFVDEDDEVPELEKLSRSTPRIKHKHKHKHRHHHHKHHRRHHYNVPQVVLRQEGDDEDGRDPDEEFLIASHRLEDIPGMRRHLIRRVSSVMHPGRRAGRMMPPEEEQPIKSSFNFGLKLKKKYDHQPHEVFVELDELYKNNDGQMAWKEKARWIKFEEDVEEGANKWGKPHVASLSFHSLLELRIGLEHGTVMLDLDERDISGIAYQIVEQMIVSDQIKEEERGDVLRALLMQHRHVRETPGLLRTLSSSSLPSLRMPSTESSKNLEKNFSFGRLRNTKSHETKIDIDGKAVNHADVSSPLIASPLRGSTANNNLSDTVTSLPQHRLKPDNSKHTGIMRQIPPGAEATTVLVGAVDFLRAPCMAFVRLAQGTVLDNFTEVPLPVRFLFVLLGPSDNSMDYTEIGRSLSTLMANENFHKQAYEADRREDILDAINEFLDESIVLPPGDWNRDTLLPIARMHKKKMKFKQMLKQREEDTRRDMSLVDMKHPDNIDPLKRTGCLFGGLINDVKRRYPRYLSDFKDALNLQCLAALIFIYFAALSPAITFGGLLGEKTDKWMGVSEMIVGTAVCGVIFGLFSAQPLHIIGATGPVLIFEEAVYQFSVTSNIEFLPFRAWIGIWVFVVTVIVVAFEGSTLVRFFTRFTEELFTALVSLIFIFEVLKKLSVIYSTHPLIADYCWEDNHSNDDVYNSTNHTSTESYNIITSSLLSLPPNYSIPLIPLQDTAVPINQPNTALLSTILTFGTFFIAYFLRKFRNSRFLSNRVRKMLGDFGVLIAIVMMVIVDILIENVYTQKLEVPDGITPTAPNKRGWFINPLGVNTALPVWVMFAAVIPALLVFILLYMETLITELIVNKKENNLKKGTGYHLNLFLIGLMVVLSSLFGLPWLCCATVRSVSHTASLTVMSKTHAPGEKPKVEYVIEQRVTSLLVNVLIGISLAMQSILRQIPIAVLFGVFLYMGVTSLSGLQFFQRMQMLFMPGKHHPDVRYVRKVRTFRIHIYTLFQLICFAVLWVVKSTIVALAFPFVLILMVPIRFHVLGRIFSPVEIDALDNEEVDDDSDDWDVYRMVHMPL